MDDIKSVYKKVDVLLDVGCGIRPYNDIVAKTHICIEPYKEYVEHLQKKSNADAYYVILNTDACSGVKLFSDKSVDTICMIDLIEHLEKEDGFKLLNEASRVARKQIVVFTPFGFFPQIYHEGDKDAWGYDGIDFQQHKSGWLPEDFGDDWDFYICEDFINKDECHIKIDKDYGAFFAIKNF